MSSHHHFISGAVSSFSRLEQVISVMTLFPFTLNRNHFKNDKYFVSCQSDHSSPSHLFNQLVYNSTSHVMKKSSISSRAVDKSLH